MKPTSQKKYPGRAKDEQSYTFADGDKNKGNTRQSQTSGFGSFATQRKEKKGFVFNEQQVCSLFYSNMRVMPTRHAYIILLLIF